MKFVAVTYGTEGDTRPLAALCAALMNAGHEARLLADHATLGSAKALGVPVTALAGDIKATLQPALTSAGAVAGRSRFKGTANALAGIANSHAEPWLRETVRAGEGCDAVIVSGLAAFVGLSAAEYLGVTAIGTGLIPITPTAAFASPFFPPSRVPSFLNRVSHEFVNGFLWRAFRKRINAARENVCGLPSRRDLWNDHPMLYGISPSLLPRPEDWPSNAQMCGQWIAPSAGWSPPQDLTDFLAKGEAPIYVGFGSMTSFDTQKALQEVPSRMERGGYLNAARKLSCDRRHASRMAFPENVDGHPSWRFGYQSLGGAGWRSLHRGSFCRGSVLLGGPAPARWCCARPSGRKELAGIFAFTRN
jgi:sterol 3beta-glucosyltransferase